MSTFTIVKDNSWRCEQQNTRMFCVRSSTLSAELCAELSLSCVRLSLVTKRQTQERVSSCRSWDICFAALIFCTRRPSGARWWCSSSVGLTRGITHVSKIKEILPIWPSTLTVLSNLYPWHGQLRKATRVRVSMSQGIRQEMFFALLDTTTPPLLLIVAQPSTLWERKPRKVVPCGALWPPPSNLQSTPLAKVFLRAFSRPINN